jgi:thymidylate synthase (FAD)
VDTLPDFYAPTEWRNRPEGGVKQGSCGINENSEAYEMSYGAHIIVSTTLYDNMVRDGIAPEMARMVLPQSMMTSWYWSGNLLAFAHVYKERIVSGAQLEAQQFAKELDAIIRPLFPHSWAALVGECNE